MSLINLVAFRNREGALQRSFFQFKTGVYRVYQNWQNWDCTVASSQMIGAENSNFQINLHKNKFFHDVVYTYTKSIHSQKGHYFFFLVSKCFISGMISKISKFSKVLLKLNPFPKRIQNYVLKFPTRIIKVFSKPNFKLFIFLIFHKNFLGNFDTE